MQCEAMSDGPASGTSPEPLPSSGVPDPARSTIVTDLSGDPLTRIMPSATDKA